jgi:ElaB/YqjD/DUF883 family membrane-anchored ribosome-binding protein
MSINCFNFLTQASISQKDPIMATHQDTRINEQRIQDAAEKLVSQRTAAQTWSNVKTAAGVGAVIGSLRVVSSETLQIGNYL